jgi:hypothetical protein
MFARAWNTSGEALDLADGHSAAGDLLCEIEPGGSIGDGEKSAGVAGSDLPFLDEFLDRWFEFQEADGIRDGGPVFAGAFGDLLLREVKFVGKALEGVRLLDGIEILALEVLDEGHLHRHTLGYVADDDGHSMHLSALRGTPAALACNQLITLALLADDERLHDAAGTDGLSEFIERVFAEARARLIRARIDQVNVGVVEAFTGCQSYRRRRCGSRCVRAAERIVERARRRVAEMARLV